MEIWSDMEEIPQKSVEKPLVSVEKSPETWSDVSCLSDSDEKTTPSLSDSPRFAARKLSANSPKIDKSVVRPSQKAAKSLGIAKPKKPNETLDATWKMITEGKGINTTPEEERDMGRSTSCDRS